MTTIKYILKVRGVYPPHRGFNYGEFDSLTKLDAELKAIKAVGTKYCVIKLTTKEEVIEESI